MKFIAALLKEDQVDKMMFIEQIIPMLHELSMVRNEHAVDAVLTRYLDLDEPASDMSTHEIAFRLYDLPAHELSQMMYRLKGMLERAERIDVRRGRPSAETMAHLH